jgi:hypothetical protein
MTWRKSSFSGGGEGDCVEVSFSSSLPLVGLRDSKNSAGPTLTLPPESWLSFLATTARPADR